MSEESTETRELRAKVDRLESRVADLKASKRAQKALLKRALVQIEDLESQLRTHLAVESEAGQ